VTLCLAECLITGRLQSSFYLKLTSVLDFLFSIVYFSSDGVSFPYFARQCSICFSNKNPGSLQLHFSHFFSSLLLIELFSLIRKLPEICLEVFLGEMIIGFSELQSLRWYFNFPLKKEREQCWHCSYSKGRALSISILWVYSKSMLCNNFINIQFA
jgi:hypothetical protein